MWTILTLIINLCLDVNTDLRKRMRKSRGDTSSPAPPPLKRHTVINEAVLLNDGVILMSLKSNLGVCAELPRCWSFRLNGEIVAVFSCRTMKLIILNDYDQASEWAAKYIRNKILHFQPGPNKFFTLGLPTGTRKQKASMFWSFFFFLFLIKIPIWSTESARVL